MSNFESQLNLNFLEPDLGFSYFFFCFMNNMRKINCKGVTKGGGGYSVNGYKYDISPCQNMKH